MDKKSYNRETDRLEQISKRLRGLDAGEGVSELLETYVMLRRWGDPKYILEMAEICEGYASKLRNLYGNVTIKRQESKAAREVKEFLGEEHEPGNPRIQKQWKKTTDFRGNIRFAHPKKPLSILIVREDLGSGRFFYSSGLYDTFYNRREEAFPDKPTQEEAIGYAVEWMKEHPTITEQQGGWEKLQETETYFEYVSTTDRNITLIANLTKEGWEIYLFNSDTNKTKHLLTAPAARERGFVRGNIHNFISSWMKNNQSVTL